MIRLCLLVHNLSWWRASPPTKQHLVSKTEPNLSTLSRSGHIHDLRPPSWPAVLDSSTVALFLMSSICILFKYWHWCQGALFSYFIIIVLSFSHIGIGYSSWLFELSPPHLFPLSFFEVHSSYLVSYRM